MNFGEYVGGQKGQDLRDYDRGFIKAVSHVIEVGIDEVGKNQVIRKLKDFWDDYTVFIDVFKHSNERTRGDSIPVMKQSITTYRLIWLR
jgi:hypothetical protein